MTRLEWVRIQCELFRKALLGDEVGYRQNPVTSIALGQYDYDDMEKEVKASMPNGSNARLSFFWSNLAIARGAERSRGLYLEGHRKHIPMPRPDELTALEFKDGYWIGPDPKDAEMEVGDPSA